MSIVNSSNVSSEFTEALCRVLFGASSHPPIAEMLTVIPAVDSLSAARRGSVVIVKLDLDIPYTDEGVTDLTRIDASLPTLSHCINAGMKAVVIAHVGRDPALSLQSASRALEERLGRHVFFLEDWYDAQSCRLTRAARKEIDDAPPGSVTVLENLRHYDFDRQLWSVSRSDISSLAGQAYDLARCFREDIGAIFINDALAAANKDMSSCAVPLVMDQAMAGIHLREELVRYADDVMKTDLLVFSGLKANKLDDLEAIVANQGLDTIIAGGALSAALIKARGLLDGREVSIGRAEWDDSFVAYTPPERIQQAINALNICKQQNVDVYLPVDFVLENGKTSSQIPFESAQLDIGPKTIELFESVLQDYACRAREGAVRGAAYLNGVMGKFEEPAYSAGTRSLIQSFVRMTGSGVRTFVGGGEGRLALERYAAISEVTHAFTAGGTILKLLKREPIPYLSALYEHALNGAVRIE